MSCENKKFNHCVCDIVREIAERQDKIEDINERNCEGFVRELVTNNVVTLNTIPLLFVCENCDFFIGSGVFRDPVTNSFRCIETPVFRVSRVDEESCCAEIELLQPQTALGTVPPLTDDNGVCRFFPLNLIQRFIRTGICMTINLKCFCGVECLPAVNAMRGTPQFPPDECVNPDIDLTVPATITCTGTATGSVTCDGEPVVNAIVFLTADPAIVTIESPVLTGADGNFSAIVTVPPDTDPTTIEITAQTTVNGILVTDTEETEVTCPGGADICDGCRIHIGIQNADATAEVTTPEGTELLVGEITVNALSCSEDCNPQPDNFEFNFRSGTGQDTTIINFTQGRRSSVTCDPDAPRVIQIVGTAQVSGNNPYPNNRDFTVTIDFSDPNNWHILADDGLGNVFETTFTGTPNPNVIEECNGD